MVELYEIDFKGRRLRQSDRKTVFEVREKCAFLVETCSRARFNDKRSPLRGIATASNILFHKDKYDLAVLVTGDKDFLPVLSKVESLKKAVFIASFKTSCSGKLSKYPIVWLDDLSRELELQTSHTVSCDSDLHEGSKEVVVPHSVQKPFYCIECRSRYRLASFRRK
jgi:hypothetical protein